MEDARTVNRHRWMGRNQREELKCYGRYAQEEYNADYGVCHSWVQLYPAGAAIVILTISVRNKRLGVLIGGILANIPSAVYTLIYLFGGTR